jgi:copper(I)-binding protein
MVIKNTGTKIDRLLSVSADFAKKVEVHNMEMQGDVMKMRKVTGGLEIPAGGEVRLQPGGLHVMFMGISEQMKFGETRKVTLQFEKAGEVEFEVPVKEIQPGHRKMDHSDHGMSD